MRGKARLITRTTGLSYRTPEMRPTTLHTRRNKKPEAGKPFPTSGLYIPIHAEFIRPNHDILTQFPQLP